MIEEIADSISSTQLYPENTEAYLRAHSDEYICRRPADGPD